MSEPDYIVIRAGVGLPDGFLPPEMDGRWYDRSTVKRGRPGGPKVPDGMVISTAVAVPVDRFEVREDGAVAQVWELQV